MNVEELLKKLESVKYDCLGYPAICLIFIDNRWQAFLRNEKVRTDNSFEGETAIEALQKLYDYCKEKKYV